MNDLQIFNYGEIPVRTVLIGGEPWWVLADVCKVLGIKIPVTVQPSLTLMKRVSLKSTLLAVPRT